MGLSITELFYDYAINFHVLSSLDFLTIATCSSVMWISTALLFTYAGYSTSASWLHFLVPLSLVPERTDQQILARPPALLGLKP